MNREEFAKKVAGISWAKLAKEPEKITIEVLWRIYADHIFKGKEISAVQYQETKQAFFIGFGECFKLMSDFAGDLEEDHACNLFSGLARQINDFQEAAIKRDFA